MYRTLLPCLLPLLLCGMASSPVPQRLVSCTLASDETLIPLLKAAGRLSSLVAVSVLADNAHYSNVAPVPRQLTGRCGDELESLLALKPDVAVLASYNRPEFLARLQAAGVKTVVLSRFASLTDIEANVTTLGQLVHAEPQAAAMLAELRQVRQHRVEGRAKALRVLEFSGDLTVSSSQTLFDDLATAAGLVNAARLPKLTGWPRLSPEVLASLAPDYIIASGEAEQKEATLRTLRSSPGWKELSAVRDGRLILVSARHLGSASQFVGEGLRDLEAAVAKVAGP